MRIEYSRVFDLLVVYLPEVEMHVVLHYGKHTCIEYLDAPMLPKGHRSSMLETRSPEDCVQWVLERVDTRPKP